MRIKSNGREWESDSWVSDTFCIDECIEVQGMHIPSSRWNGFAIPSFPIESVIKIAEWLAELDQTSVDVSERDVVTVTHFSDWDRVTMNGEMVDIITIDGVEHYDVGGCSWVWDEVPA